MSYFFVRFAHNDHIASYHRGLNKSFVFRPTTYFVFIQLVQKNRKTFIQTFYSFVLDFSGFLLRYYNIENSI